MPSSAVALSVGILSLIGITIRLISSKRTKNLPPSPPKHPLFGHAKLFWESYGNEDKAFYELGQKYGPICYLSVLGQSVLVLNSQKVVADLLDKRGSVYSSRPRLAMVEIMGFSDSLAFLPYGHDWRIHRRIFQKYFHLDNRTFHQQVALREARLLLKDIAALSGDEARDWESDFVRFATSVIISINYGHRVTTEDDTYVEMASDFVKEVMPALMSVDMLSAALVTYNISLNGFPEHPYLQKRNEFGLMFGRCMIIPYKTCRESWGDGTARPSFLTSSLEDLRNGESGPDVEMKHVRGASATVYFAGAETTTSSLLSVLGTLLLYPEVQKKAQAEIDEVVGPNRLPDFGDRDSLPYLECVVQEVARWQPVALIQGRENTEDDIYEGMFISKGTAIVINSRGIHLDPDVYHEPFSFNPDRYRPSSLGGRSEPFPTNFGAGRRICPGRFLASDVIWIVAAHLLATMSIISEVEGDAAMASLAENVVWKFTGTVNRPLPFKCRIAPRNPQAQKLLDEMALDLHR